MGRNLILAWSIAALNNRRSNRPGAWFWPAIAVALAAALGTVGAAGAQEAEPLGSNLEAFAYPWPVRQFALPIGPVEGQMSFMDVLPKQPNGQTAILLHGKNFCGATWESTTHALLESGYRVLIPDQVGFCKSSKPREAQYSFAMLANFTRRLMDERGIEDAVIIGHSTGGMLAMHFAKMYPEHVRHLVLINPLGLANRAAQGGPYVPLNKLIEQERSKDRFAIKDYQLQTYYHGDWKPDYDRWVDMLAGQYVTDDDDLVEIAQAKTSEMILTQPIAQHLEELRMPVTLMIGMRDTTTFGKGQSPAKIRKSLKPIPELAESAAQRIPNARLIRFPDYGHSPQVEAPEQFNRELLTVLARNLR